MIYPSRSLPIWCLGLIFAMPLLISCAHQEDSASVAPPSVNSSNAVTEGAPRVRLFWRTETEDNAFAFFVYRAAAPDAEFVCINAENPLPAIGNSTTPQVYVFYDLDMDADSSYYYRLQQVDLDGAQFWIAGHPEPVLGRSKPLTAEEASEIALHGTAFRRSASDTP